MNGKGEEDREIARQRDRDRDTERKRERFVALLTYIFMG